METGAIPRASLAAVVVQTLPPTPNMAAREYCGRSHDQGRADFYQVRVKKSRLNSLTLFSMILAYRLPVSLFRYGMFDDTSGLARSPDPRAPNGLVFGRRATASIAGWDDEPDWDCARVKQPGSG